MGPPNLAQALALAPTLLRLGPLELRWSGALLVVGLALGALAIVRTTAPQRLPPRTLVDLALWSLPEAALAARLAYVLVHPDIYLLAPARIVHLWDGGFAPGAGLLVGLLAAYRLARQRGLAVGRLADAALPGLLLAHAFAALGGLLDAIAAAPLGSRFSDRVEFAPPGGAPSSPSFPIDAGAAYATPLVSTLWAAALLAIWPFLAPRLGPPGVGFSTFLALLALGHVAASAAVSPRLSPTQLLGLIGWSLIGLTAAAGALYHYRRGTAR